MNIQQPTIHFKILLWLLFGEWSTCWERGFPGFLLLHLTINVYFYYQRWLSDLDGCCHCWLDLHEYGLANIDDDNICIDDGCLGEDMIIPQTSTKWWFYSPCYWDIWMFSFPFWFICDCLSTNHYCMSSMVFFRTLVACFLLSIMCVHNLTMCASYNDYSTNCCTWSTEFLIPFTHHS